MSISQFPMKPPVTAIAGIWKFVKKKHSHNRTYSTPGHLLHLVLEGSYILKTNGREYLIRPGDVIYYHECEEVESYGNEEDVTFYSVSFMSDTLGPLPLSSRVFRANRATKKAFRELYLAFTDAKKPELEIYAHLMEILSGIKAFQMREDAGGEDEELWWRLENHIRRKRLFTISVKELAENFGKSRSTIVRACKKATKANPLERIRGIRMAEAKALLVYSTLNVSQTAESLGYSRMHEFSREFSKYFGFPPQEIIGKRKESAQGIGGHSETLTTLPKKMR